ncbi:MAG: tRNA guanosine(34) transglycosylase Tgt [Chloroflexi bacterium]|nr:tRNA guanosine(34) transglycosylase Tgt [Chloroflexota bacterium]
MSVAFHLHATDGAARAGLLSTPHGETPTPAFIPVATQGSVKAVSPQELRDLGATILLGNTYHLYLRPGPELVRQMGGLTAFMGWNGPTLTDSGGFQAYSLGSRVKVSEEGVTFQSVLDGSRHLITPEQAVAHQEALGADIMMALDQCLVYIQDRDAARAAMERTGRWAARCRQAHASEGQALFGIVQGGVFPELREQSAACITGLDFPGYAIGGLAVGEPKAAMYPLVSFTVGLLPQDKPRHLLGVGSPEDLVECVARGVDLFDCALPTRVARNGALFTRRGRVDITTAALFRGKEEPVEEECDCYACRNFSAGYLHHLFRAKELLALRLASIHNLRFIMRLMEEMRSAVIDGTFKEFASGFLDAYRPADEEARQAQRKGWLASREREG